MLGINLRLFMFLLFTCNLIIVALRILARFVIAIVVIRATTSDVSLTL
jgi:hypothetical protein